jgi:hypothetical protein
MRQWMLIVAGIISGGCGASPGTPFDSGETNTDTVTDTGTESGSVSDTGEETDSGTDSVTDEPNMVSVTPSYYDRALRNPLKGITTRGVYRHEWATLAHVYIRWNEIEDDENDDLDEIIDYSNEKFKGIAARNVKVIPRVYLHWDGDQKYWPADLDEDDYFSDQFKQRLIRLIERLGEAWNEDPRVAFVEMGIFGKWGEQEVPSPADVDKDYGTNMEQTLGDAFTSAFPDKIVSVRHIWDQFPNHKFGQYWDSWGHNNQIASHGVGIKKELESEKTHKTHYIGGEVAYDWGSSNVQPGDSPDDTLGDPIHRDFMINTLKWLHCTQLRWIDNYDQKNPESQAGAEKIQRVMGYRFVLEEVKFTPEVEAGELRVSVSVKNEGSAPFYYDWPVEVSLLDLDTHAPVWSSTFSNADVRNWQPGSDWTDPQWTGSGEAKVLDGWSTEPLAWGTPPATYQIAETFSVTAPQGTYILALAVLDPAGMVPSLRFATSQYFKGGRHPIGLVAVGSGQGGELPESVAFDDPGADDSLYYVP